MNKAILTIIVPLSILTVTGCHTHASAPADGTYSANSTILGDYRTEDDGSTLKIAQAGDSSYNISLHLFRLTEIDDAPGRMKDNNLIFTGTDASGKPISGKIAIAADTATVTFTASTWLYLPAGTTRTFVHE